MALTTVAAIKSYLNLSVSTHDTILATLLAATEARILQHLGRTRIESGAVSNEAHSPNGQSAYLVLAEWPATAITSVTLSGTALSASDYELQSAEGFLIYLAGGTTPVCWPAGIRNVVVSYTAGYASVPADIALACIIQTAWDWKRTAFVGDGMGGRLGERQQVVGDGNAIYMVDAWAPEATEILAPHRRARVA